MGGIAYLAILFLTLNLSLPINCQSRCRFVTVANVTAATRSSSAPIFINNFSGNNCLRIANFGHYPSKLFLDECFWSTTTITKDEKLYFRPSKVVSDGVTIFNDAGMSQEYCLSLAKDGFLQTANCQPSSWDQIWKIKTVRGHDNLFQIQQASSSLCIQPSKRVRKSPITLNSCNSYVTEQLWKLCATTP